MQPDQVINTNPLDLHDDFAKPLLPLSVEALHTPPQQTSARLRLLKHILDKIETSDFPSKEYFAEYMRDKYRRNCRPNTLRMAACSLPQFLSFYHGSGKPYLEQLSQQDIEAYIEYQQDRGLKPRTVRTRLGAVYAFIRFLYENKILGYELLERRIKIKLPDQLPRAMAPQQVNQLLAVIDSVRDRALILLLLRTGMRIGELLSTTVDDIDLNHQRIFIYQAQKTGVGRVVYHSDDAQKALVAWLKVRDAFKSMLFYGRGRPSMSYQAARCMYNTYLNKAGLGQSGYTLHCLRHTFATDLLNARMPLECLRVLLGHRSLEVTRIYARLTDKTREREYFAAMERILKGECDADDQCDH